MNAKNWFEVDKEGLKQLQEGKSKTFVIRELLQNAFDEEIKVCVLTMTYSGYNKATISVEDDSPIGFRDLTDAYTLYKQTYKRKEAQKRGRFNLGEKQCFSICESAEIITTTGGLLFDKEGRKSIRKKREKGSIITVILKMNKTEFDECWEYAQQILIPKNIEFIINYSATNGMGTHSMRPKFKEPFKTFEASLKTELEMEGIFRPTVRKTFVDVHKTDGKKFLYEMGLPVCEIECDYSIDVQQKIPLSADRDSVIPSFLKDLYAEVLNKTFYDIPKESSSNIWVREATTSNRINQNAVRTIIRNRFGDHAVIANPSDRNSIDEAISKNYNVIYGNELSKEEWANIKKYDVLSTSTQLFGASYADYILIKPTNEQASIGKFAQKIAKQLLGIDVGIVFLSSPKATTIADFGDNIFRFNVDKINSWTNKGKVSQFMLDLIIHELGHSRGMHYQHSYHECITLLGAKLTLKALADPDWFKLDF